MADLNPLIRLRRYTVEEKQKALSQLYREQDNIQKSKQVLIDQLARERDIAESGDNPEAAAYFPAYADNVRKKIATLEDHVRKMDLRIAAAQEEVRAAFAELKKVQIIQRNREERDQKKEDAKQANALDEIAIEGFRRKEDSDG